MNVVMFYLYLHNCHLSYCLLFVCLFLFIFSFLFVWRDFFYSFYIFCIFYGALISFALVALHRGYGSASRPVNHYFLSFQSRLFRRMVYINPM